MRYPFSDIDVRAYPNIHDLDNPYIFGGVRVIVNVSEHRYPLKMRIKLRRMGIRWYWFPLKEEGKDMGLANMMKALAVLKDADGAHEKVVLHCMCGTNRSRTVAEAFCFMKTGEHFHDEYRNEYNHLQYNCSSGHLPERSALERMLEGIRTT